MSVNEIVGRTRPDDAKPAQPGSVEDWAIREPDREILFEDDRTMTWAQIDSEADSLAEALARGGIEQGHVVAVRTQIRMEWAVIDAALSKLGCRELGLNWRLTPPEVHFVLTDSQAAALICDDPDPSVLTSALDGTRVKVAVSLDAPSQGFLDYRELVGTPATHRVSEAPAPLVIYTSGTTGRPKGVVMKPRAGRERDALEYFADIASHTQRTRSDAYLATMPFSHGAGPSQVRACLKVGARVVLQRRYEPASALDLINRHGVTTWVTVPTMLKRLAALPDDVLAEKRPTTLRQVGTGAAPVPASLKEWVVSYLGDILHEGYGASEVGMITHADPAMRAERPASSGLPHPHVHLDIRDENGTAVPPGRSGEIWVQTPVVIDRYLGGGPLGPEVLDAEGYFRTGDIGYVDEEGYLFITDRAKDMIVSGGVNIYPAEVEAALLSVAQVQDAAVIGIPDEEFGEQVKAFVELKPGATATAEEVMAGVRDVLASYKRPRSIDIVDELPRNLMGKLLKKDLRALYWEGRERKV
ncbi:class I adenylate-forming enzyme family protein [Pseudonocardia sp.]|uniref:class I adenylate-forming enzyme family protein n=1 Tax=Pseudonocardia sp. TaxID=60912 RepID=UPI0031FE38AB